MSKKRRQQETERWNATNKDAVPKTEGDKQEVPPQDTVALRRETAAESLHFPSMPLADVEEELPFLIGKKWKRALQ